MTARIRFTPVPTQYTGFLNDVPAFPGDVFPLNVPEVIGDASHVVLAVNLVPNWIDLGGGRWKTDGHVAGELDFELEVTPAFDTVDLRIVLTNRSTRIWADSLAFPCFNCGDSPTLADFECARHWSRSGGQFRRLVELPRTYSDRPTIQLYNVEGATPVAQLPFLEVFHATSNSILEGWLAIQSRIGNRVAASVSKPALFLFQNMEFSCIHAGPSFGTMNPGQTREALTRLYLVRSTLADWYQRMTAEMA